jgi:hypothetical protein
MFVLKRTAVVACTFLVEVATLAALVAIGRAPALRIPVHHLGAWLRDGDPATVVVALLRGVAVVGAGWLVASTALYVAASVSRVPAAMRAVGWTTLPAVRRAVDAACAVSVATTIVLAPTAAGAAGVARGSDPPSVSVVRDGRGSGGSIAVLPPDTTSTTTSTTTTATTTPPVSPPAVVATVPASLPATADDEVVLVEGDNLWTIAASHLARVHGRPATDDDVAAYWLQVCDVNRPRLHSGDVNLVFPGERIALPPVS